MVLTAKEFYFH